MTKHRRTPHQSKKYDAPPPVDSGDGASYYTAWLLTLAALAIALQFFALGPLRDTFWGFHLYAFLPAGLGIVNLALLLLAAASLLRSRGDAPPAHSRFDFVFERPVLSAAVFAIVLAAFFWLARSQQTLLGDATPLIADLPGGKDFHPRQPLTMWLQQQLYQFAGGWFRGDGVQDSEVARNAVALGSVVAGFCFVIIASALGHVLTRGHRERKSVPWLVALLLVSQGYAVLFFGYVENYTFSAVAIAGYLLASLLYLRDQLTFQVAAVLLVLGIGLHLSMVALLPSFVFLLAWGVSQPGRRRDALAGAVVALVGAFALNWVLGRMASGFSLWEGIADMATVARKSQGGGAGLSYMFSWQHVRDFVNEHYLIGPLAGFLFVPAAAYAFYRRSWGGTTGVFLILAAGVFLAGSWLTSDPLLGYARDWDLFAPAAVCYVVCGVFLMLHHVDSAHRVFWLLGFGFVLSIVLLSPWVRINHSEYLSLERFKTLPLGLGRTEVVVGNWYYRNDRVDESIEWFKRALEKNPYNANAYAFLGSIYAREGEFDKAADTYDLAVRLRPDKPEFRNNYSRALIDAERYDEAVPVLVWLLERAPERVDYWRSLAGILRTLERSEDLEAYSEAAVEAMRQIQARRPDDFDAIIDMAIALSDFGRDDVALEFFQRSLEMRPDSPVAMLNTALALMRAERTEEARAVMHRFVELHPQHPEAPRVRAALAAED